MLRHSILSVSLAIGTGALLFVSAARGDANLDAIVAADNALGLALLERLAATTSNIILSPHGIGTTMAMAVAGARGETEKEMVQVLGYDVNAGENADVRQRLGQLLIGQGKQDKSQLVVSSALHLTRHGELVAPSYKQTAARFGAELFSGSSLATINDWVRTRTNGRIPTILPRLDPNSVCVLLNATYFKGVWQTRFIRSRTAPAPFQLADNTVIQLPTMRTAGSFSVVRAHAFDAIALPYRGSSLAMVILLPMRVDGIGFLSGLPPSTAKALLSELKTATPERMELWLPRFSVSFGADLIPPMQALGMKLAFDRDRADFSGITESTDEAKRLHISQVQTRAFIDVDEEGTEAAASTAVEISKRGGPPPQRTVKVDRPFVFLIADLGSGSILFAGRVMDPRKENGSAQRKQANSNGPGVRIASDRDDAKGRIKDLFKSKPGPPPVSGARIGGPCSYASYPGRCTILNVQKTGASIHQKSVGGGPGYEGYEVKFRFAGVVPADNKSAKQTLEREHELRLTNSWYPGPRFLDKYGIAAGKTFSCTLKVIEKGACSPIAFEFPAINQTDYFESGR